VFGVGTAMKHFALLAPFALLAACYAAPPPPPPITPNPPGGSYHALGTEPFWDMTIDEREIIFTDRGNNVRVAQPTPSVIVGIAGEIYRTPRIGVNIVHAQCSDGMSDRVYPDKVQADIDGKRYNGCGGAAVAPASLAGTNWRVAAVNGRPTPPGDQYFMNFEADRFGSKFGCNRMGGGYRQDGNLLIPRPIMGTKMACPDMSFEDAAGVVLSQPLTMLWQDGDRLQLSSGPQRTIDLMRSY